MKVVTIGDWKKAKEILEAAPDLLEKASEAAVIQEATWLVGEMKKRFRNLTPPNSPFTILMKKSSKPGINKGDLRNAMTVVRVSKLVAFVGIPSTVRAGSSKSAASLADIIENGRTIVMKMTDKQRKYLHATLGKKVSKVPTKGGDGILVIHIPPRPFIRPTFDMAMQGAQDRLLGRVLDNLKRLAP